MKVRLDQLISAMLTKLDPIKAELLRSLYLDSKTCLDPDEELSISLTQKCTPEDLLKIGSTKNEIHMEIELTVSDLQTLEAQALRELAQGIQKK